MTAVWPDCAAATTPGVTVRDQLDYLIWITEAIEPVGLHATDEVERWRPRVDRAYLALIDAMVPGHGDPLPPDVPPSVRPGTWPDVPSATIPGMTVRHQLTVIRTVSQTCRANRAFPHLVGDIATWASRVQTAHDALDHGPALAMPPGARTEPPPPPPPKKPVKRSVKKPVMKMGPTPRTASPGKALKATTPGKASAPAYKKAAATGKKRPAARPKAPTRKAKNVAAKRPVKAPAKSQKKKKR